MSLTACLCWPTDEIHELHEREQELGIKPDPDLLAFMKASAKRGKRHSIMTDYVMRILGLEVCDAVGCASPGVLLLLDLHYASAAQAPLVLPCWFVWSAACFQGKSLAFKGGPTIVCMCRVQALMTWCRPPDKL